MRLALEKLCREGAVENVSALLDIDFQNAFPSIEWDSIREAVDALLPQLSAWCAWCHEAPTNIVLPSGRISACNRGAEQGDPLGPIYCAVVLALVLDQSKAKLDALGVSVSDVWYMDDGQVVCQPMHVDLVLRTIDEIALKVGLVRGRGENAKTVCRLIGPPSEKSKVGPEWFTEYMRESSVQCNDNDLEGHVLGINFDDRDSTMN